MSRSRKRRHKGQALPKGKFIPVPVDLLKKVSGELSAPELRCWFAVCAQSQPWCNGTAMLCRSVIKEFHLGSQRVVTAATKKLLDGGYIIRTRTAKQRVAAMYGVTHLPLSYDAMERQGILAPLSDTNRGSANSATNAEALNSKNDIRGSAKPLEQPLVLPQGKRIGPFSTSLALPQGNTSKNLPSPKGISGALSGSGPGSESPSPSAGGPTSNIEVNA